MQTTEVRGNYFAGFTTLELRIIELLAKAKTKPSKATLSDRLGIADSTAYRKYLWIMEKGFVALHYDIDESKFGLQKHLAFITSEDSVAEQVLKIPNVSRITELGPDKLIAEFMVKTEDDIKSLTAFILSIPKVLFVRTEHVKGQTDAKNGGPIASIIGAELERRKIHDESEGTDIEAEQE